MFDSIHGTSVGSRILASAATPRLTIKPLFGMLSHGTIASGPEPASRRASSAHTRRARGDAGFALPACPARRLASIFTSCATVGLSRSSVPSGSSPYPVSVTVRLTIAVDGRETSSSSLSTRAPSQTSDRLQTTTIVSPVVDLSTKEYSPSCAVKTCADFGLRPVKAAMPHSPNGSARAVYQAWCERWKAPNPMCTIRTGAAATSAPVLSASADRDSAIGDSYFTLLCLPQYCVIRVACGSDVVGFREHLAL